MEKKKWYRSKTLWTNIIGIVVILFSSVFGREDLAEKLVTSEASVLAVINFILRIVTKQGLEK